MVTFNVDGARELAADLGKQAAAVVPLAAGVVAKGALNIKTQMQAEAKSSGSYRHFANSINYDTKRGGLEAEIGPDKSKTQGALGNILYFGTSKNAPVLSIDEPLEAEQPKFEKAITDIADRL